MPKSDRYQDSDYLNIQVLRTLYNMRFIVRRCNSNRAAQDNSCSNLRCMITEYSSTCNLTGALTLRSKIHFEVRVSNYLPLPTLSYLPLPYVRNELRDFLTSHICLLRSSINENTIPHSGAMASPSFRSFSTTSCHCLFFHAAHITLLASPRSLLSILFYALLPPSTPFYIVAFLLLYP